MCERVNLKEKQNIFHFLALLPPERLEKNNNECRVGMLPTPTLNEFAQVFCAQAFCVKLNQSNVVSTCTFCSLSIFVLNELMMSRLAEREL